MPRSSAVRHAPHTTKQTPAPEVRLVAEESQRLAVAALAAQDLGDLAQAALRATGADGIAIALQQNGAIVCRARAGTTAPSLGATVDTTSSSLSGQCLRTGTMLVCNDTETDSRVNAEVCRQLDLRSIVAVPLRHGTRNIGLLAAFALRPNAFPDSALEVIEHLA